ncbi:MAG: DUF4623 domain-containing protein [Verrucomicrobia bacterium]|nr:DUF4623 domain-containing protein [Verrucomicrobiota bacterium]
MFASKIRSACFLSVVALASLFTSVGQSQTEPEFRALWVDAWGSNLNNAANCFQMVTNSRAGNINALVIQARRRGDAFYNSNYEPKSAGVTQSNFDPLGYVLTHAHDTSGGKKKIEIHAWLVTYHIWRSQDGTPPAGHPLTLHPDWLLSDVNGNTLISGQYTFDPGHPEVQRHTYNVTMDIVTNYPVDGINFDYVRYSSVNEGYNPVTVARFNRLHDRTGQPIPTDAVWKQFRRDQITSLLRKIYLNVIDVRPEVKLSADTITWAPGPTSDAGYYSSSAAWNSVLQDWRGWMEEGIIDINMPMNYFRQWTHLNDFINWSTYAKDRRFNRHLVNGPGIYLNSVEDALWQMRHSRTPTALGNKADGMMGYVYKQTNKDGVPTTTFIKSLVSPSIYETNATPLFQTWVPTPEMPWKTTPTRGHLKGYLLGHSATNFLDGGTITISGPVNKTMKSDATGFYGAVDLLPGNYSAAASFPGYALITSNFTVTTGLVTTMDITLPPSGLSILDHPVSQTVNAGANVTFSVSAVGQPPVTYQWLLNSTNLPGATQAHLDLFNVQAANAGTYSVIVSNPTNSLASSNAILTVRVPPGIIAQPQSVSAQQGDDVTFSVEVTGSAPLSYQWRRNAANIVGATQDSYTRLNVQPADAANYSVVITNLAGSATSSSAVLTVSSDLVAPYIVEQPQSRNAYAGQSATFRVRANGSAPFTYQWRFNTTPIADATRNQLTMSEIDFSRSGSYSVVISNSVSGVTSAAAQLTVVPPFTVAGMQVLWKLAQGSRSYVTANSTERGIAYNPVSGNVLLVSRANASTRIYALDGDTGNEVHIMNMTGVTGGTFALNMIGVADDGVVYACNLVTGSPGFKIYRWENDAPTTAPTVLYNGNPAPPETTLRWGDSFDVRGSGKDTQILIGARNGTAFCIFTTTDGSTFTPQRVNVSDVPGNVGLSFGEADSFWTKETGQPLRHIAYQTNSINGTILDSVSTGIIPGSVTPIGINTAFKLVAGVTVQTPHGLRLYNIETLPPTPIATEPFATDNSNPNFTGAVDFGEDRLYAKDTNNGLMALRLLPLEPLRFHSVTRLPDGRIAVETDISTFSHGIEGSSDLVEWTEISAVTPTNGYFEFSDPGTNMTQRFYRLKQP